MRRLTRLGLGLLAGTTWLLAPPLGWAQTATGNTGISNTPGGTAGINPTGPGFTTGPASLGNNTFEPNPLFPNNPIGQGAGLGTRVGTTNFGTNFGQTQIAPSLGTTQLPGQIGPGGTNVGNITGSGINTSGSINGGGSIGNTVGTVGSTGPGNSGTVGTTPGTGLNTGSQTGSITPGVNPGFGAIGTTR